MRRKLFIVSACFAVYLCGLVVAKHALTRDNTMLYDKEVGITQVESDKLAESFKQLAEARLGKDKESVVSLATNLLEDDTSNRFLKKYSDYLKNLQGEADYIIIDKEYAEAKQNFQTEFDMLRGAGYLTDSGDLTEKALTKEDANAVQANNQDSTSALQADTNNYSLSTDFSDFPDSKDGIMDYVDAHTLYVGDGEEIVEQNESRKLPFMLLGYTSIFKEESIEPITRAEFDSASYEEMANRAKSIISLSNYDLAEYTEQSNSFDTRTEEEKEAYLEKSREAYRQYLAYAEKQNYSDEGDGEEDIPDSVGSALYERNFKNPETSSVVKENEQGQRVVYWADIQDSIGKTVTIKLFEQDYTIDLSKYVVPMRLYENSSYSLDSYEYFIDPMESSEYTGRLHIQLSSNDKRNYVFNEELRVSSSGKIVLTDEQIDKLLEE